MSKNFHKCIGSGTWLAGPAPIVREEAQLKVEQNLKQGEFSRLLKISVNGKYSVNHYITQSNLIN